MNYFIKVKFCLVKFKIQRNKLAFKKQRMDLDSKDFLGNVKALAYYKHLKVESLENSAKLGSYMSESGKLSLNTFFKLVYL